MTGGIGKVTVVVLEQEVVLGLVQGLLAAAVG
jgi:hypothetical protein